MLFLLINRECQNDYHLGKRNEKNGSDEKKNDSSRPCPFSNAGRCRNLSGCRLRERIERPDLRRVSPERRRRRRAMILPEMRSAPSKALFLFNLVPLHVLPPAGLVSAKLRGLNFAETVGFEPTRGFLLCLISSEVLSTTQPRLRGNYSIKFSGRGRAGRCALRRRL